MSFTAPSLDSFTASVTAQSLSKRQIVMAVGLWCPAVTRAFAAAVSTTAAHWLSDIETMA